MLYIPTDEDLYRLARDTPVLHQALAFHRGGHCTFDDAIRLTVAALAAQLKASDAALIDRINREVAPTVVLRAPAST